MPARGGRTTVGTVSTNVEVRDNPVERRFEAYVDDKPAGFSAYDLTEGTIVILHTGYRERVHG